MSDSEDENFCFYGKALEPYDEDAVPRKKPISVEEQVATDAQGRRRFHGAFTGGFSAGFYNTVGSLEGWKPSEFKSSRSEKAQAKSSKPEDFMDDEDIGEHGFAPHTVKATNDYASNRKRKKQIISDGPIPGEPVLHTLISRANETIGYLLMKNMDLKQKPKASEISNEEEPKVYGCFMPKAYEIKRNADFEDEPKMYLDYIKNPKSNTFGLGYQGLDKAHMNLFKSTQLIVKDKNNKKLSISGQAFGVGAFENEDEDIYAKDDMTQYDFELTSEKKMSTKENKSGAVFDCFLLSKVPLLSAQTFPPPTIPHSFSGKHKVKKSRFEPIPRETETIERKDMTAIIRAKYIGEDTDYSIPSTSNKISENRASAPVNTTADCGNTIKQETENKPSEHDFTSDILNDRFVSASQVENPHDILEEVKKSETDHGTKEMRDAAKLKMYGPLTRIIIDWQPCSLLCKRFNIREPLLDEKSKRNERKKNHIIFEYQKNNEDNVALQPGLRITKQEESSTSPTSPLVPIINKDINELMEDHSKLHQPNIEEKEPVTNASTNNPTNNEITETEDKKTAALDITDKINVSKNIDLFKAVFLSSSESESENEEKKEEEVKNREDMMKENVLNDYLVPKIKSTKQGILSHIKFNPLFQKKSTEPSPTETINNEQAELIPEKEKECQIKQDVNIYGPVLPDKIQTIAHTYKPDTAVDDEWIEKDDVIDRKKSHKHKKKHKKEKHHKKEHKSKHKR